MLKAYWYRPGQPVELLTEASRFRAHLTEGAGLLWVDIGEPDDADIECLLECFGLHPLTIEDCILPNTRPKVEVFDHYAFLVAHGVGHDVQDGGQLVPRELDICVGKNFLITVHGEPLESISKDLSRVERQSPIIMRESDFLLYAVLDSLLETFFPIIDEVNDRVDDLEQQLLGDARDSHIRDILNIQSHVIKLRRILTPQRDVVGLLQRGDIPWILPATQAYFRDLYDRFLRMSDLVDGCREIATTLLEAHAMINNNKLNEAMKVLTVLASFMVPMTLIASIYGMNFDFQPEYRWRWGYPFAWLLMLVSAGGMFWYVKRRRWL